jgi:hypothetical protein
MALVKITSTMTLCSELMAFLILSIIQILNTSKHTVLETDPVSETLCLPVFRILDAGQSQVTQ